MGVSQVVKITSKGQFTLPVKIRRDLSLGKGSYVYMTRLGPLIVIKKLDELSPHDISTLPEPLAKRRSVTRKILAKDIERARERMFEKHGKTRRSALWNSQESLGRLKG